MAPMNFVKPYNLMQNLSTNFLFLKFSVSLESSVMGHDEMLQVLKEKMRLEGQLESLSSEASQVIKLRDPNA